MAVITSLLCPLSEKGVFIDLPDMPTACQNMTIDLSYGGEAPTNYRTP